MERDGRHIRASIHSGHWLSLDVEIEVSSMSFINEDGHVVFVSVFDEFFKVTDRTKVSWVDDEDGFGGCISVDGLLPLFERWLIGNLKIVINLRHDINRNGTRNRQSVDDGFVDVTRKDDLLPCLDRGHDHGDDAARSSVD